MAKKPYEKELLRLQAELVELQEWVRARLAGFKVPVQVRFVKDVLPRNAQGKILKTELRTLFAGEAAA